MRDLLVRLMSAWMNRVELYIYENEDSLGYVRCRRENW